ncbi:MAG TPA: DUF6265 family protein [Chitinophagaceae bacterium]|nr:DUF6265 family protein [Chitinophagaceae bacterium]
MKSIAILIVGLLSVFACQQDVFNELQQLSGTWKMETKRGAIYESWSKTGKDEMLGKSFKLNGNDTITLENVRLSKSSDGLFYIPIVPNQNEGKAVSFKMINSSNSTFVFENKAHDFPQRIIYHLISKDSVHAWIEGTKNGKEGRSDFYYKRVQ